MGLTASRLVAPVTPLVLVLALVAACGSGDQGAERLASESPTVLVTAPITLAPNRTAPNLPTPNLPAPTAPVDVAGTRLALQAGRDRWRAAGIDTYEHQYTVRCVCEPMSATVRVLGGRPIGAAAGQGVGLATVEQWFTAVADALDTGARVEADFDDDLGHPLLLLIDPDATVAGDEYGLATVRFSVVRDPLDRWFTDTPGSATACGNQFAAATPDQTALVVLRITDGSQRRGTTIHDVASLPTAEVRFGSDLLSHWCDDVAAPAAPTSTVLATWALTAGTVGVAVERSSRATGDADALVATTPDGAEVELGDATLRSGRWG